jgi:hypothetical protein
MTCRREEIGDPFMDGILYLAGGAPESAFEDLLLILRINMKREISLADRAAENVHK